MVINIFSPANKATEIRCSTKNTLKITAGILIEVEKQNSLGQNVGTLMIFNIIFFLLSICFKEFPEVKNQVLRVVGTSGGQKCCFFLLYNYDIQATGWNVYNKKPNNIVGNISFQPKERNVQKEQMVISLW